MFTEGGGFRCFIGWHDFWIIDKNIRECSRCKCYQIRRLNKWQYVMRQ